MKVRFYVAPQQGDGTMMNPYRSIINDLLDNAGNTLKAQQIQAIYDTAKVENRPLTPEEQIQVKTLQDSMEWFDEIDHPARRISICCVHALDTSHAVILADSRAVPISELYEEGAVNTGLERVFNSIVGAGVLKTKMENQGISASWITNSNTMRDVLRYLVRIFTICQVSDGEGNTGVKDFLKANLTMQVKDIPAAARNAIKTWMQAKGLAIGWITNITTVREVVHFIVENLGIGKLRLSGEEF